MQVHLLAFLLVYLILGHVDTFAQQGIFTRSPDEIRSAGKDKKVKSYTYHPDGSVSTISSYKNGELVRYLDYFNGGQLFQKLNFRKKEFHGAYQIWSEEEGRLLKGKMKKRSPYSGEFDRWDEELKGYRTLRYRKGKVISGKSTFHSH
jgi:antitoxin component YwqK of YwqJK toxin-antitoxin module